MRAVRAMGWRRVAVVVIVLVVLVAMLAIVVISVLVFLSQLRAALVLFVL
jgi:hypothetical protein